MARRCVLSVASAIQVRALCEEARRGPALLPRQAARRGRLRPLPRDPSQGAAFGKSQSTHRKIFNTLKKKKKQARSNKAANKPDSELNEFESVRLFCSVFFFDMYLCIYVIYRFWRRAGGKARRTRRSRSAWKARRQRPRNARRGGVRVYYSCHLS